MSTEVQREATSTRPDLDAPVKQQNPPPAHFRRPEPAPPAQFTQPAAITPVAPPLPPVYGPNKAPAPPVKQRATPPRGPEESTLPPKPPRKPPVKVRTQPPPKRFRQPVAAASTIDLGGEAGPEEVAPAVKAPITTAGENPAPTTTFRIVPVKQRRRLDSLPAWGRPAIAVGVAALLLGFVAGNRLGEPQTSARPAVGGGPLITEASVRSGMGSAPSPTTTVAAAPPAPVTTTTAAPMAAAPPATVPVPSGAGTILHLNGSSARQSAPFKLDGRPLNVRVQSDGQVTVRLLQLGQSGGGDLLARCPVTCAMTTTVTKAPGEYFVSVDSGRGEWSISVFQ